jgi:hypothetical protein
MRVPDGQQPEYRIRHFSEKFERVALENELSAGESEHGQASKSQGMTLSSDDPLQSRRKKASGGKDLTEASFNSDETEMIAKAFDDASA